ncbi:hypothetical protein RND81_13G050100 [Saponaria officinalis]|uniref:DNA helicase Pif1-like 2B domain-containing protein n=1 Tax=Saponaria officinalis TaxID=3572 RepID=A0AAW1GU52_SAPOF
MHPPIMPLPIHLPNMQSVQIRPHEKLDQIVSSESRTRTPLTEFFRTNEINGGGQTLYGDFTELYRWDTSHKKWFRRKNKLIVVGRLAFVAPAEGERYFLRLLLLHVRGPRSFEDLMTVDGYRCTTFQEAALKHRLLEEDDAVEMCLKEASEVQMPFAVRRLFATLLVFCQPSNPLQLWTDYYNHLSEDFTKKNPNNPMKARSLTVRSVEQYLEAMGKTLKCFGLDHIAGTVDDAFRRTKGGLAALIREADLLIWDEASMARKENIESLEVLLRDLCNPKLPFGEFSRFLLALGNGELQHEEEDYVEVPTNIVKSTDSEHSNPLAEITSVLFEELGTGNCSSGAFTTQAILTPMNEDVDALNSILIEKFPGKAIHYKSFDMMLDDNCNIYPSEFINKLCPGGMSPHDLVLKENYPVILLRNILPSFCLCNGTRLVCSHFFPNLIDCIIVTGHHKGEHAFIPRVKLRPSTSNGYPFQFQRTQFPIKLSFAMTINKSQGQTLNKVAIYLRQPCCSPGQLYVALSL